MMRIVLVVLLMLTSVALYANEQSEKILNQMPEENILEQAKTLMKKGEYSEAIHLYSMLLDRNPFSAVAANNLALAHAAVGNYTAALELLEKAAKIAPKRNDIIANLTIMRVWMEEYPESGLHPQENEKMDNYAKMVPPKPW